MSDRPLGRALIRLGALALGRSRAHRQDLWPHLTLDRATGTVRWRGALLTTLAPFSSVMPRTAPFLAIVGSGPSLREQRVAALPAATAILLNGAASLADQVQPLAVAVEDERFVFRHLDMLARLPREVPLFLSPAALRAVAERDTVLIEKRVICLINNLAKPVNYSRRSLDDPELAPVLRREGEAALSLNPDAGVVITGTVAFSALQIAIAAAPREVLLAGVDLSNADQPRFYEATDRAASGLVKGLPRILAGFALARAEAEARGIALTCASPVSALLGIGYRRSTRLG